MTDLQLIKHKIYEEDKTEYILEQLGCTHIKYEQGKSLIVAKLPDKFDSINHRSVQIKIGEKLTSYIRSKNIQGDIFNIVQYIQDCDLSQSKYWLCNILGYDINFKNYKPKKDWNSKLHDIQRKRRNKLNGLENDILPEITMLQFADIPSYEWWMQGINYKAQCEFEVKLDGISGDDKIVFPIRDENNKLLTVKARFTEEFEHKHKDMKYFYIYSYNKQLNLYNLNKAKDYIDKEVYVFEGEKSCMLAWQWGIKNCVAIQGNQISPVQIHKLLQLKCKINFVFDKDIQLDFFDKYKNQLQSRLVYVIIDTDDLLCKKNSPVDKGKDIFLQLINKSNYKFKISNGGEDN